MEERVQEIIRALEQELRNNNALRHRMGIEGAADAVAERDGEPVSGIVWADEEGRTYGLRVFTE